jgi:hypothetical protein
MAAGKIPSETVVSNEFETAKLAKQPVGDWQR